MPRGEGLRRKEPDAEAQHCVCNDRPAIRATNLTIARGTRRQFWLDATLKRDDPGDLCYSCRRIAPPEWWSSDPGMAEVTRSMENSCIVTANETRTGSFTLNVRTRSQCKCRRDGHLVGCTCTVGTKGLRVV
jgi:hypothetical protein